MSLAAPPYPQRFCHHSQWHHPPWTPNGSAAAPYESTSSDRHPGSRALQLILLFLAPNGIHQKIERWVEHQSWVLLIDGRCNNQQNDGGCWWWGGCWRGNATGRNMGPNRAAEKMKIERAAGPSVSMASNGWGDATTNRMSAHAMGYSNVKQRAGGRCRWGRMLSRHFSHRIKGQRDKKN
jgi:hypothetical protein